jgi:hypothetical protein
METVDLTWLATVSAGFTSGFLQWIKQHNWFRNKWCIYIAPLVCIGWGLAGLWAFGILHWNNGVVVNGPTLYNMLTGNFTSGILSVFGYNLQKTAFPNSPVAKALSGPDNNKKDIAEMTLHQQPDIQPLIQMSESTPTEPSVQFPPSGM